MLPKANSSIVRYYIVLVLLEGSLLKPITLSYICTNQLSPRRGPFTSHSVSMSSAMSKHTVPVRTDDMTLSELNTPILALSTSSTRWRSWWQVTMMYVGSETNFANTNFMLCYYFHLSLGLIPYLSPLRLLAWSGIDFVLEAFPLYHRPILSRGGAVPNVV